MNNSNQPPILNTSAADLIQKRITKSIRRTARCASLSALIAVLAVGASQVDAATTTWVGAGADNLWSTAGNFTAAPGFLDDLVFAGNTRLQNTNDFGNLYNSISFGAGAGPFVLSGVDLAISVGGIANYSSSLQTLAFTPLVPGLNGGILLLDSQTWNAAAGDLLINTDVTFGAPVLPPPSTLTITGSHNVTITGVINEQLPGSLIKNGSGTLYLPGHSTYKGDTIVNAGSLIVNGSIASTNTFVNGGTLGGSGLIGGTVFNSGNVAPGNSPGKLTIGGNYNQSKSGTLTIEIAGKNSGQYDVLAVKGKANLNGTLRLVQVGKSPRLKVGDKITFLTAGAGVSGKFSTVINPISTGTIVETGVVYRSNSVALEAQQGSFAKFASREGLTFNQRAVAGGLDSVAFRNQQPKLIEYLNGQALQNLPGDFDLISPDELSAAYATSISLANVQSLNLQRRTADLRAGSSGFSAAGYHVAGSGPIYSGGFGVAGPTGNEGKESKFVVPPENRWGVFLTGVGEWVDVDGDGNARGYDLSTGGFTLGADYKASPNFALGITAGYAGTSGDLTGNGDLDVNSGKLGFYATYFTGGFYVDTAINVGYNSYDTKRSSLQGNARGSTDGKEVNLLLGTGYDWKVGALTIGPTATLQYTYVGIDGFTETGSLSPLNYESQSAESIRTALGFKASYDWKVGGVIIKPEVRAAWQHEFGDDAYDVNSSFQGGSGNLFTVRGPQIGRDSMLVGAGVAVLWNERTSTYVYYDGELFRDNYDSQNVSGGVRIAF